jgi:hypothetical protein
LNQPDNEQSRKESFSNRQARLPLALPFEERTERCLLSGLRHGKDLKTGLRKAKATLRNGASQGK